jgi:hypothetical protein
MKVSISVSVVYSVYSVVYSGLNLFTYLESENIFPYT